MSKRIALCLLALSIEAGCNSGDTRTPVPSNTPVPSPQDGKSIRNDKPESAEPVETDQPTSGSPAPEEPVTADAPVIAPNDPEERRATPPPTLTAPAHSSPPADLERLVQDLASTEHRDAATRRLVAQGSAAVETLMGVLQSDNWEVRAAAVFTLAQLGSEARVALPVLKRIAETDETPAVRDAAAFAIDAIEQPQ